MEFKNISRQDLTDKATSIINKPPAFVHDFSYESREWRKIKNKYIKENSLCELCLNEGTENKSDDVHHITPISQGGEPFLEDNLIALCQSCHGSIHASAGIALELSIDSLLGLDRINNFTTQLKNVDERTLSQCKVGDNVILMREHRQGNPSYVGVANKSREYIGEVNPQEASHHYLAFDIDHGSEVSVTIKEIFTKKNKLECVIEIKKSEIDWAQYERFNIKEKGVSELIYKAYQLEKTDYGQAIQLYRKATEILIEIDRECKIYPKTWRSVVFPINRMTLVLERNKEYKECLEEIEAYEKLTDEIGLYAGEKARLEKRKEKIKKIISNTVHN